MLNDSQERKVRDKECHKFFKPIKKIDRIKKRKKKVIDIQTDRKIDIINIAQNWWISKVKNMNKDILSKTYCILSPVLNQIQKCMRCWCYLLHYEYDSPSHWTLYLSVQLTNLFKIEQFKNLRKTRTPWPCVCECVCPVCILYNNTVREQAGSGSPCEWRKSNVFNRYQSRVFKLSIISFSFFVYLQTIM